MFVSNVCKQMMFISNGVMMSTSKNLHTQLFFGKLKNVLKVLS